MKLLPKPTPSFGRRRIATICAVGTAVCWATIAISPSYLVFCFARYFNGFFDCGVFASSMVFLLETTGKKYRNEVGFVAGFPWSVGYMVLPWIAYGLMNWRHLAWCVTVPAGVFSVLYLVFMPESPRWSIVNARYGEAEKALRMIAKVNGKDLPEIDFETIYVTHQGNKGLEKSLTDLRTESGWVLLRKRLRKIGTSAFSLIK